MSTPQHGDHQHADDVSARECADFLQQIVYLLDNELDDATTMDVRAHLESCSPCLQKYDLQRTVKAVVARSCSEPAPSDLRAKVMVRLQQARLEYRD